LQPNLYGPILTYDPATGRPYFAMASAEGMQVYQGLESQYNYLAAVQNAGYQHADSQQKEYLGYYVDNNTSQQMPPPSSNMPLPRSNSHTDLAQRRDKNHRDLQPLKINGNKKASRSPSPLGHARNFSTPLRSAPLPGGSNSRGGPPTGTHSAQQMQSPPTGSVLPNQTPLGGLLIVNGSSYSTSPPESERAHREGSVSYSITTPDETSRNFFDPTGTPYSEDSSANQGSIYDYSRDDNQGPQNGTYRQTPRLDSGQVSSTIGSPVQPFPSYNEATLTPLAAQEEEVVTSPTRKHHSPYQTFSPTNGITSPTKVTNDVPKTPGSKSAPVLSPVIENRMPTPQMQRRIDMHQAPAVVNGSIVNGSTPNGNLPQRPSEPVPPTPANIITSMKQMSIGRTNGHAQQGGQAANQPTNQPASATSQTPNQWQTTGTTKRRANRKRSKSGPATRSATDGQTRKVEPLPQHPEDRKGG
jgi:hypothetical protein